MPKFGPDGRLLYTAEEFEAWQKANPPDPRERVWCACGHSLLVHPDGKCEGIHVPFGEQDGTACRCPMFFHSHAGDTATPPKSSEYGPSDVGVQV